MDTVYTYDDSYLTDLYKNVTYDGYGDDMFLESEHCESVTKSTDNDEYSETLYGELLPSSLHYIIENYLTNITATDVVYDLGSGIGKIVIQFAYETSASKCVGIELGLKKYESSMEALHNIVDSSSNNKEIIIPNIYKKISFVHGDIMKVNWMSDATILFINAFVFGDEIMNYIESKIIQTNNYRNSNNSNVSVIKYILLFGQRFPPEFLSEQGYTHQAVLAPQSFSDDANCELYIHNSCSAVTIWSHEFFCHLYNYSHTKLN